MKIEDKGQAFDWAWAFYHWFKHNHGGITCGKYEAICKLVDIYRLDKVPPIDFENNDCDDYEMAVIYYHELDESNWQAYFKKFCYYMDKDWDKEIA